MQRTRKELIDRMVACRDQAQAIADKPHKTLADDQNFQSLGEEIREIDKTLTAMDLDKVRSAYTAGHSESGTPSGVPAQRGGGVFDEARRTLEQAERSGRLPDYAAERAERLVVDGPARERTTASQWVTAAGDPAYGSAFSKLLADPTRGHLMWNAEEHAAYQRVEEMRAMSLTDASGGYMVPLDLDPAIILTSAGSINPLRQISRVVQTTSDSWNGVSSAGVTAEWLAEASEAADASPTLAQPSIPNFKGSAFVPYSYEVGMDALNFADELGRLLSDAADQLQATAFTTGNGTTAPQGIVTGLAGTAAEVNAAADDTFAFGDVYTIQNALGARFSANARWTSHLAIGNLIRQFETANGAHKFPGMQATPPTLLGKPWHENSNMDSSVTTTGAVSNHILIYGDYRNYVITDRIGSTVELIPNLVGANRRPTGQRGLFLWFRTGAEVVNVSGFKMLDVASAA